MFLLCADEESRVCEKQATKFLHDLWTAPRHTGHNSTALLLPGPVLLLPPLLLPSPLLLSCPLCCAAPFYHPLAGVAVVRCARRDHVKVRHEPPGAQH